MSNRRLALFAATLVATLLTTACGHVAPQGAGFEAEGLVAAAARHKPGSEAKFPHALGAKLDPKKKLPKKSNNPRQAVLPMSADLRADDTPVRDQGQTESCVAFAVAGHAGLCAKRAGRPQTFSPLYVWYITRWMEGTQNQNVGTYLKDALDGGRRYGYLPEAAAPYPDGVLPTAPAFNQLIGWLPTQDQVNLAAQQYGVGLGWHPVTSGDDVRADLASGKPVVMCFNVYKSFFNTGKDGLAPMPPSGDTVAGGHGVLAVGYDDSRQVFIIRNSWGANWGDHGYFYMPYQYLAAGMVSEAAAFD